MKSELRLRFACACVRVRPTPEGEHTRTLLPPAHSPKDRLTPAQDAYMRHAPRGMRFADFLSRYLEGAGP